MAGSSRQIRRGRGGHRAGDRRRARTLAVLAALAALCLPLGSAAAQEPLPDDNAGTDQYIEPVPDAGGDRPAGSGPPSRPGQGNDRLPPGTREALPGGEEGQILGRIATDPGAGAPSSDAGSPGSAGSRESGGSSGRPSRIAPPEDDGTGVVGAVKSAVVESDSPAGPLLLLAVVLMAGAAAFARRPRRN